MAQAQMVKRRVFTDGGELLREGMAPKDVPNTRADLMAWWERQDQLDAEAEALKAEAGVAELNAPAAPDPAELIAPLADELAALSPRVAELEALRLATPEAVLEGSMQIARAAGAAALVEGAAQVAIAKIDGVAAAADARLGEIEGSVNEAAAAVGQLLADGRERLDQVSAEMLAKTAKAISKRIAALEVAASQLRGPKGNTGRIGQGLIAGAGKRPEVRPDGHEWAPGDSWLNTKAEGFQLEYMDAAGEWSAPTRLVPAPKLLNATQNVLDMAPRQYTTLVQTGSGSGGGGERLLVNRANVDGSSEVLADSSNWAGVSHPLSGELMLDIRALDGSAAGQTAFLLASFKWDATDNSVTEFSLLGDLVDAIDVDLTVSRTAATSPGGVTVTIPPGATSTQVSMRLLPKPGFAGAVNRVSVAGTVEWSHPALGRARDISAGAPRPLWLWV